MKSTVTLQRSISDTVSEEVQHFPLLFQDTSKSIVIVWVYDFTVVTIWILYYELNSNIINNLLFPQHFRYYWFANNTNGNSIQTKFTIYTGYNKDHNNNTNNRHYSLLHLHTFTQVWTKLKTKIIEYMKIFCK